MLDPQLQPDLDRSAAARVFILADDLTGACDSGAAFRAAGRAVRIVLNIALNIALNPAGSGPELTHAEAVLAFTTETRNLSAGEAALRVARAVDHLRIASSGHILFKKVDSAARGHLGVETMAALNASGAALALVAPAFPQAGRTVRAGFLSIRDAAAQDTTVALLDLFPGVEATRIDSLPVAAEAALEQGIARALASGIRVLLCDSQTQADLDRLATAASRLRQPILWTGSSGLARALAATLPPLRRGEAIPFPHRPGRTLLFVGTDHPVTTLQVSHLENHCNAPDRAIHRVNWTSPSHHEIREAFAAAPTAALVLTGGETAAFVLQALDAVGILLAGELAPGIPWGIVEGGVADGCVVVTKSGGFGPREALVHVFDCCSQIHHRRACAPA
jgi:uncharacterized protein YgbK (DUF1537 family)